jgi:REP element-mobilizing transposase RayT
MARGIDQTNIFVDDADRAKFLGIVEELVFKTGTKIPAWSIMDNHYHLLILSGPLGLPAFMRKLMTRYAVYFNKRRHRAGHLFQNRYKSVVCEEEPYFLELVRYIHLNPLRAGMSQVLMSSMYTRGADTAPSWAEQPEPGRIGCV